MAATCNNICKAATSLAISITTPSLSTSSSHLLLPSLSLLPKSSRNLSTSSFKLTHVVKNPGRVNFRVMSSLSDSELEGTVKKTINDYPVVVYSKSWCSWVVDSFYIVFLFFSLKIWFLMVFLVFLIKDSIFSGFWWVLVGEGILLRWNNCLRSLVCSHMLLNWTNWVCYSFENWKMNTFGL